MMDIQFTDILKYLVVVNDPIRNRGNSSVVSQRLYGTSLFFFFRS